MVLAKGADELAVGVAADLVDLDLDATVVQASWILDWLLAEEVTDKVDVLAGAVAVVLEVDASMDTSLECLKGAESGQAFLPMEKSQWFSMLLSGAVVLACWIASAMDALLLGDDGAPMFDIMSLKLVGCSRW